MFFSRETCPICKKIFVGYEPLNDHLNENEYCFEKLEEKIYQQNMDELCSYSVC